MQIYESREDKSYLDDVESAIGSATTRILYSGNVMTFLSHLDLAMMRTVFAKTDLVVRLLMMYPFALYGRDRMAVERHRVSSTSHAAAGGASFDLRQPHWIPEKLTSTLQLLIGEHYCSADRIRLSLLNPLCSVLVCDDDVFLSTYHYGRSGMTSQCTAQTMPVIRFGIDDDAASILADHAEYLWNQPTSLPLDQCVDGLTEPQNLVVVGPQSIRLPSGIDPTRASWVDRGVLVEQAIDLYCPRRVIRPNRSVFISHGAARLDDAKQLRQVVEKEYYAFADILLDEDLRGQTIFDSLHQRLKRSTHAIVLASDDGSTSNYPRPNVIHEIGWCQAMLGSESVLLLLYPGTELPSNLRGLVYERFAGELPDLEKVREWLGHQGFIQREEQ